MRRLGKLLSAVAVVLMPASSFAETLAGAYDFSTIAQKPGGGGPVCVERWEFGADGTLTTHSGQEVVTEHVSFDSDKRGNWMTFTGMSTNGLPDCMGNTETSDPNKTTKLTWFPMNDGSALVCAPPPEPVPGQNPTMENCFARLVRTKPGAPLPVPQDSI